MRQYTPLTILAASAIIGSASAATFDPPDLKLEMEMHARFQKSIGIAEVPALARDGYIESYIIQPGETLWSLSHTLYGDGHFWPRVWAQNRSITNPHLIRPGHTLQFILGSEDETPSFRISEPDDSGLELIASANSNPLIDIPPPEIPPRRIIKVPKSFPEWQSVYKEMPLRVTDDRGLLKQRRPLVGKSYLTAFVQEDELSPAGRFLETDLESSLPVVNQYVYVRINSGSASPGQKMLIVRDAGRLKPMNSNFKMPKAHLIQIAGELELSEAVKGDNAKGENLYRALLTKVTSLSTGDYSLIPGELDVVNLNYEGTPGMGEAQIIGNGRHQASALYAPGDIVFLNKGSADGLEANQIYDVYADRVTRKREAQVHFSPAPSGSVRVVRVTPGLATAVVLGARDGIQPGDMVRQVTSRREDREILEYREGDAGVGRDEMEIESDLEGDEESGTDEFLDDI